MIRNLRMNCPNCGHWNHVPVNKIFIEQKSPEPKVRVLIPMYEPLEVSKCKKCSSLKSQGHKDFNFCKAVYIFNTSPIY